RSVAICCGPRAIGVVLTGTLGDGASGLWALRRAGGIAAVQDPSDALFPEMPMNALKRAWPDYVVHLAQMPSLLDRLVREPAGKVGEVPDGVEDEVQIAKHGGMGMDAMDAIGRRSVLACPDCGGVMWEIQEGELTRYRCHV